MGIGNIEVLERYGIFVKIDKIVLKGGHVPYKMGAEELQQYLQEIKRGCGGHGSKKDYRRKPKHKGKGWD